MGGGASVYQYENLESENYADGTYYYADDHRGWYDNIVNTVFAKDADTDMKELENISGRMCPESWGFRPL